MMREIRLRCAELLVRRCALVLIGKRLRYSQIDSAMRVNLPVRKV